MKGVLTGFPVKIECALNSFVNAFMVPGIECSLPTKGLESIGRSTLYTSGYFKASVPDVMKAKTTLETYASMVDTARYSLNTFIKDAYSLAVRDY